MIVLSPVSIRIVSPVAMEKISAPCAMRWPNGLFAAHSLFVCNSYQSPVSPAKLTMSVSVIVRPGVATSSPISNSSKYFPIGFSSDQSWFHEHQEMLLRQEVSGLFPHQPDRGHFHTHLLLRHFMQPLDRHARVFAAVLDQHDAPARVEAADDAFHHFPRVRELVIGVHHQHHVNPVRGQLRIGFSSLHRDHVVRAGFLLPLLDEREHFRLNVHGVNLPPWDERTDAEGEIAGSRADVGDIIRRFELQISDHLTRQFGLFAVGPFEPAGSLMPHDVGDLAAQVKFADAVRVVLRALLINRGLLLSGGLPGSLRGPAGRPVQADGDDEDARCEQTLRSLTHCFAPPSLLRLPSWWELMPARPGGSRPLRRRSWQT